jgi:hypothetical protein
MVELSLTDTARLWEGLVLMGNEDLLLKLRCLVNIQMYILSGHLEVQRRELRISITIEIPLKDKKLDKLTLSDRVQAGKLRNIVLEPQRI